MDAYARVVAFDKLERQRICVVMHAIVDLIPPPPTCTNNYNHGRIKVDLTLMTILTEMTFYLTLVRYHTLVAVQQLVTLYTSLPLKHSLLKEEYAIHPLDCHMWELYPSSLSITPVMVSVAPCINM